MEQTRPAWIALAVFLLGILSGCAHVISREMRNQAEKDVSFPQVFRDPDAYRGKIVIWGGKIIETLNREGSTLIRILQIPLDFEGMPGDEETSQGRFLAQKTGYVDPEIYRRGRLVTVAGEVIGWQVEPLGAMEYRYPLVEVREIHLWRTHPYDCGPFGPPCGPWYDYYWGLSPWLYYRPFLNF